MLRSAVLLLGVFAVGTLGYRALAGPDHSWIDALYMTTITLTTVGYEEAIPVDGRPAAQVFTVLLLLSGAGSFVYFFSQLTAFLVEGTVQDIFRRRHMERWIGRLDGHHVVCGAGHSGEVVVKELLETGRPCVVVDSNEERADALAASLGQEIPIVVGDATEDEVLIRAGVQRARGLVTCIGSDKDNILVVFAARNLNPGLRIVARSREIAHQTKLRRAGADAVVSPEQIGGLRLVSETIRPTVVSFLDLMLRDTQHRWRVEGVTVAPGSSVEGTTVEAVRERGFDVLLMALRRADGQWIFNPKGTHPLPAGTEMVILAGPDGRAALEAAAQA